MNIGVLNNIQHGFGGGNGTWCVASVDFLDFRHHRLRSLVTNLRTFEVSTLFLLDSRHSRSSRSSIILLFRSAVCSRHHGNSVFGWFGDMFKIRIFWF